MIGTRRAAALTAAGALVLTAAGAVPASAEVWRHSDARKDVTRVDTNNGDSYHKAPRNTTSDVTRIVVRHSKDRVILRMHLRDITAASGEARYRVRTSNGGPYAIYQLMGDDQPAVRMAAPYFIDGPGGEVDCPDANSTVNRRKDFVRLSVPRGCLGNPAWVRVGGAKIDNNSNGQVFADSAKVKGFPKGTQDADDLLVLGRRVHRG